MNFAEFQTLGTTRGVRALFRFSLASGAWQRVFNGASIVDLNEEWYYPSTVRDHNGDVVVVGHHDDVSPAGQGSSYKRELFQAGSLSMDATRDNARYTPAPGPACTETSVLSIFDYAKTTLLSDGTLMWIDAEKRLGPGDYPHVSHFVDLVDETCPGSAEPYRWIEGELTTHNDDHAGGNAVHYVFSEPDGFPLDVIYNLGGTKHGEDDSSSCSDPILDLVERFTYDVNDESPQDVVWDESVVPLRDSRKNSNAVILLDGSILVLGGLGYEEPLSGATPCEARLRPERLQVPEIDWADPDPQWRLMAPHQAPRVYHSVALMLADGRVVLAGGQDYQGSTGLNKSLEIYKPPFCFRSARPEITTAFSSGVSYEQDVLVDVDLPAGLGVKRVALLAIGSVTHTTDWNQRYVELDSEVLSGSFNPQLSQTLRVTTPDDAFIAPPGYYFLTVVDDDDIPSPGILVRLGQ